MQYEIWTVLPQRYPLLLLDKVLSVDSGRSVKAIKNVSVNEYCYEGIGSDACLDDFAYPWSLVIESFAQAAGILLYDLWGERMTSRNYVIMFGAFNNIDFGKSAVPGDVLEHNIQLVKGLDDCVILSGTTTAGNEMVVDVDRIIAVIRSNTILGVSGMVSS